MFTHSLSSAVFLFLYVAGFVHFQLDFLTVNGNNVFFLKEYGISDLNTNNQT